MRARIQRGVETGADFSYAALQLFSLEKCDEHRFKYLIALKQSAKLIQQEIKSNVFTKKKKRKREKKILSSKSTRKIEEIVPSLFVSSLYISQSIVQI